jgi:hypothetical protein
MGGLSAVEAGQLLQDVSPGGQEDLLISHTRSCLSISAIGAASLTASPSVSWNPIQFKALCLLIELHGVQVRPRLLDSGVLLHFLSAIVSQKRMRLFQLGPWISGI